MMLDWNDVRLLLAVAAQGSYAKAARQVGVSVATIGRRLRVLEISLGTSLVERRPDGHRLTPAAKLLLPAASRMAAAASDLSSKAGKSDSVIRIMAREWEALFLTRHIENLRSKLPNIDVHLISKHWVDLAGREAELVLTDLAPTAGGIIARKLGLMAFAIYASHEYYAKNAEAFKKNRLENCLWVGFTPAHRIIPSERWMARHRTSSKSRTQILGNACLMVEAIKAGVGIGLLPVWLGDSDKSLVRVSDVLPDLVHRVSYLMNEDLRNEPLLRSTADAIALLFKQEKGRLMGKAETR